MRASYFNKGMDRGGSQIDNFVLERVLLNLIYNLTCFEQSHSVVGVVSNAIKVRRGRPESEMPRAGAGGPCSWGLERAADRAIRPPKGGTPSGRGGGAERENWGVLSDHVPQIAVRYDNSNNLQFLLLRPGAIHTYSHCSHCPSCPKMQHQIVSKPWFDIRIIGCQRHRA